MVAKTDWAPGNTVTSTELNALGQEVNGKAADSHGTHRTDEEVQDLTAGQFTHANHTNITASYDDTSGEVRLSGSAGGGDHLDSDHNDAFAAIDHTHAGGSNDPLAMVGNQVKLVYLTTATSGVATDGWYFPNETSPTLTGRVASITWEGTAAQIPAPGAGDAAFQVGDTALVRSETL